MDKVEELLTRGVQNIYPSKQALGRILRGGKKLRLYQGFDPSMPSLHLGNYVGILKMKQFQELGHEVIFLVGDFTGMIGDPTDKLAARKMLARNETIRNSQSWREQIGRILNFSGPNPVKFMFNSQWNDKVSFRDLIEITSKFTVQQMLERDMFQERLKEEKPIHLHELLYPVAQAIDCVKMDVDLELGGNDQTFNMLAGRVLMKALKNKEKFVMTTKLLVDAEGEKVGKTTGNALFLSSSPEDFYGGIMSLPDEVLLLGFELLTSEPMNEVKSLDFRGKPMELKKRLAFEAVKIIYGGAAANQAQNHFEKVFQNKQLPEKAAEFEVKSANEEVGPLLLKAKMVKSLSGVKRLVKQGAIEIDGKVVTDYHLPVGLKNGSIIRIGKARFLKIKLSN